MHFYWPLCSTLILYSVLLSSGYEEYLKADFWLIYSGPPPHPTIIRKVASLQRYILIRCTCCFKHVGSTNIMAYFDLKKIYNLLILIL